LAATIAAHHAHPVLSSSKPTTTHPATLHPREIVRLPRSRHRSDPRQTAVTISEAALLDTIDQFNRDATVHGLIVQMPLPKHIDENHVKLAVNPLKDVDGFHPLSQLATCTPKGIIDYLSFSILISSARTPWSSGAQTSSGTFGDPVDRSPRQRHRLAFENATFDMDFYLPTLIWCAWPSQEMVFWTGNP
jgi:hypothetical protein